MDVPRQPPIDAASLERAVRETDPTARVVPSRILRRVIKRDRGLSNLGLHTPHGRVYTIPGEALHAIVDAIELGLRDGEAWPKTVILIARPDAEDLADTPGDVVLTDYWRLLFHARVHVGLKDKLAAGTLTPLDVRARLGRLGGAECDEIRSVLRQEGSLLSPGDDVAIYVEFAATYLELRRFAPGLLRHTFPGIEDPDEVEALLALDIDAEALAKATRLPGAVEPQPALDLDDESDAGDAETEPADAIETPATGAARRLLHRALMASERGNVVRAAILRTQAARRALPALAESVHAGARGELDRLVRRLDRALGFDDAEAELWRKALPPLLDRSSRGFWRAEARLLYDLQKVCVDHEREVYKIDLVAWIGSLGRRAFRRLQPYAREVTIANHLRSALRRLRSVRLASEERARLAHVLRPAVAHAEAELRDRLRGPLDMTLSSTGLLPRNLPERVAYRKLLEELLDRIVARGFLSIGELRDAFSRNNLKLPDLSGPSEFLRGDRLLQADRALDESLDGVYRRGEIYLRWLQRFSSLAFATRTGRFLTRYVVLPFGGTYILLEGLQHILEMAVRWLRGSHVEIHLANTASLLLIGSIVLGIINYQAFRRHFLQSLRVLGRIVRLVLFDAIAWTLRHPVLRWLFSGHIAVMVWRLVLKPAILTAPLWIVLWATGLGPGAAAAIGGIVFLLAVVALNSRIGRNLEEIVVDETVRAWRQLYRDLVPGLFRLIMATFDTILETIDRLLYAVDEWLRFRSGQTGVSLAIKAVLGAIWFFVAYIIRIYVNLLIEPQVNPIKHFPVVTVSHKIILPLSGVLTKILAAPLMPLGMVAANFIAWTTVLLLPGVFGFLVWEFKENWRLYEANRRETLGRVIVGDHGETIARLLRPGFHSGTLPKLFAKLRKSERRALRGGRERAVLKHREHLHHVEESIHRFIERDFLALLHESRTLGPLEIETGEIAVATNRIRIELHCRIKESEGLHLVLEERSGQLIAGVAHLGWLPTLTDTQRRALLTAVAGLYKMSGVEWIREPGRDAEMRRFVTTNGTSPSAPLISFQRYNITWKQWVEAWERDQSGGGHPPRFVAGFQLLPTPAQA